MMQQGSYPVVYNHGVAQDTMHMGLLLSLIHISEPTRQAEISYAVFCLKKKKTEKKKTKKK